MRQMRVPHTGDEPRQWGTDDWGTPQEIVDLLLELWPEGIDLDPCSNEWSLVPAKHKRTIEMGALEDQPRWRKPNGSCRVFVNPPYSKPGPWLLHCQLSHQVDGAEVIALVKCDTSTRWWNSWAWSANAICFLGKRVRYVAPPTVGKKTGANFPSALLYWGSEPDQFARVFSPAGYVVRPRRLEDVGR